MDINVIPVAITYVNWDVFNSEYYRKTGQSPVRELDLKEIVVPDLTKFLCAIGQGGLGCLRDDTYLLRHAMATFMIVGITECCWWQQTNISTVSIAEEVTIASGTIEAWVSACWWLSTKSMKKQVRYISNCCQLHLEKAGLMEVFNSYRKIQQQDQTFILERK